MSEKTPHPPVKRGPKTPEFQPAQGQEVVGPEEYPGIIERLAELVRLIRRAFRVITLQSYEPLQEPGAAEEAEQQLGAHENEFRETRDRLKGIVVKLNTARMRNYFGGLRHVVEGLADTETLARSQGHTIEALRMLGKVFNDAMSSPLLAQTGDSKEKTLFVLPATAEIQLEDGERIPVSTLYREALQKLELQDLLTLHQTLSYFLWVQNARQLITNREVRSQLHLLIDALQDALEEILPTAITEDLTSVIPQQRLRVLPLDQGKPAPFEETTDAHDGLEPRLAAAVIDQLTQEMPQLDETARETLRERYRRAWDPGSFRGFNNVKNLPIAQSDAERDGDALYSAIFPAGFADMDVFDGAHWAAAMARQAIGPAASLLDVLKLSSLKDLPKIASPHVGNFAVLSQNVALHTLPKEAMALNHQDLRAFINRNLFAFQKLYPPEYYSKPRDLHTEGVEKHVDGLAILYLYTELCRGFEQAESLEELIEYLFPGLRSEDFMPEAHPEKGGPAHEKAIDSDRLSSLAEVSLRYFRGLGMEPTARLVNVFLGRLAVFSRQDWRQTKLFASLKSCFAEEERKVEEEVRGVMKRRYERMQNPSRNIHQNYDGAMEIGELLEEMRIAEAALRLGVSEHFSRVDPRLRYRIGYVLPDVIDQLPDGELIRVVTAFRALFVRGGVVNAAIYPQRQHQGALV